MINQIKCMAKKVFCCIWSWPILTVLLIYFNPLQYLTCISKGWYLWGLLVFAWMILWLIYKASHNCRKLSVSDYLFMAIIYSAGFFFCFTSPMARQYEYELTVVLESFTAFGPLIVGFAAALFACRQWQVTLEQKNISLLGKRLEFKSNFDKFMEGFREDFIKTSQGAVFLPIYTNNNKKFKPYCDEASILFNEDISKQIESVEILICERCSLVVENRAEYSTKNKNIFCEPALIENYKNIFQNTDEVVAKMLNFIHTRKF